MNLIETKDARITACAQVAYEALRAWDLVHGDDTGKAWLAAAEWEREVSIKCSRGVIVDGSTPEQNHRTWLTFMADLGWTYGLNYDLATKVSPYMVSYDVLPTSHKSKDYIFCRTVQTVYVALQQGDR